MTENAKSVALGRPTGDPVASRENQNLREMFKSSKCSLGGQHIAARSGEFYRRAVKDELGLGCWAQIE
jgi:hypothetical protein